MLWRQAAKKNVIYTEGVRSEKVGETREEKMKTLAPIKSRLEHFRKTAPKWTRRNVTQDCGVKSRIVKKGDDTEASRTRIVLFLWYNQKGGKRNY